MFQPQPSNYIKFKCREVPGGYDVAGYQILASLLKLQLNWWVTKSTARAKKSVNQTLLWG